METKVKPWYKSKTVIFNLVTVGGAVMTGLVGLLPALSPYIAPQLFVYLTVGIGLINVGLRSITHDAIAFKVGEPK